MKDSIHSNRGFSLVETVVAMAVLSLIATGVLGTSLHMSMYYKSLAEGADFQRQVRRMDAFFFQDIRSAVSWKMPNSKVLQLDLADGREIKYQLLNRPHGANLIARFDADGAKIELPFNVNDWTVTLPTTDTPFSVSMELANGEKDGVTNWVTLERRFAPRGVAP